MDFNVFTEIALSKILEYLEEEENIDECENNDRSACREVN